MTDHDRMKSTHLAIAMLRKLNAQTTDERPAVNDVGGAVQKGFVAAGPDAVRHPGTGDRLYRRNAVYGYWSL